MDIKEKTILEIYNRMASRLTATDIEVSHGEADDDLILLIRTISKGTKYEYMCENIMQMFDDIEKWYS